MLSWFLRSAYAETPPAKPDAGAVTDTPAETTFTQADLTRIVTERVAREKRTHDQQLRSLREALGVEEAADLAEAIKVLRETVEAAKPAVKPKADDLAAVETRWKERLATREAEITKQRTEERTLLHERLVDSEVRTLLAEVSSRLAENAGPMLEGRIREILAVDEQTFKVVPIGADNEPMRDAKLNVMTGREVVEGLLTQYPFLVRANITGGSGATPGGRAVPDGITALQARVREAPNAANRAELTTAVLRQKPRGAA